MELELCVPRLIKPGLVEPYPHEWRRGIVIIEVLDKRNEENLTKSRTANTFQAPGYSKRKFSVSFGTVSATPNLEYQKKTKGGAFH